MPSTDMSKRAKARLCELAHAARGSHDAGSRNLAISFFDMSVPSFEVTVRALPFADDNF